MSAGWDIRRWDGDEWPDKRISIVDEDGYCLAISPRFARAEDVKYMELMSEAPKMQAELAVMKRERDDFKDSMEYWELQYRGKGADLTALLEAISLHKKCILRSIGESITPTQEDLDLWAALQEKGE